MVNSAFSSIPGIAALTSYRDWVGDQSRVAHGGLLVVIYIALAAVSLAVGMVQSTIGGMLTQIITWGVFLTGLYTAYAIAR